MLDPKKLIEKLPRLDRDKPFRYLGRRVVQGMAEAARENAYLGRRSAPGRYLVVRLADSDDERERWEQQFAESRAAIVRELEREAAAREIQLRSAPEVELIVVSGAGADVEAERALTTVMDERDVPSACARLTEERELVVPRRVRTLQIESDPPEAQVYLDDRPAGVTPCRVEDITEGDHRLVLARPGFLHHEETLRIEPGKAGQTIRHHTALSAEPEMGALEVRSFPPGARVTIAGEARETPARWRLPAGIIEVGFEKEDFEPLTLTAELPPAPEGRPHVVQVKLNYAGPMKDDAVGRLIVYKPGSWGARRSQDPILADNDPEPEPAGSRIAAFFRDMEPEPAAAAHTSAAGVIAATGQQPEVLGERTIRRGVLIIGREDPGSHLAPDIKLFDAENSVTRGCHAWLWVYADVSTGATFNTFLIGNNSPGGIRVDGQLVMGTRRLSDDSEIEVGNFLMRFVKETPEARVEFAF